MTNLPIANASATVVHNTSEVEGLIKTFTYMKVSEKGSASTHARNIPRANILYLPCEKKRVLRGQWGREKASPIPMPAL
jgi:hypothetical protein